MESLRLECSLAEWVVFKLEERHWGLAEVVDQMRKLQRLSEEMQ